MSGLGGALLRDRGVRWVGLGWSAFLAENIILSENRTWIISAIGDTGYHTAYSALSTAATASIAWGLLKHGRKGVAPPAFKTTLGSSPTRIAMSFTLSSLGLIGFSQLAPKLQVPVELATQTKDNTDTESTNSSDAEKPEKSPKKSIFRPKCPMDFRPVDVPDDGVYGMKRVTRNPNFWSLGLLGAGVATAATTAPQAVAFGFPLIFALVGGAHQDSRFRRGMGGSLEAEVDAKTSNIPFLALMTGNQQWSDLANEIKWTNAGLATLAALLFVMKKVR